MATALAAQLAQVRSKSTKPLDLKAQKKVHSQSLIFDARVAATQDFDTIYQICYDGFETLCRFDNRFTAFSSSLFSEQSKGEDRSQLTATQNNQLDVVLENFLTLVGAKLLLKPALKAVEWLIRRFRCVLIPSWIVEMLNAHCRSVHESNTLCLALTFLPYHAAPVFPTILSILPQNLPPTLKFLHPYIKSLTCPPRHAIAYTASSCRPFFAALGSHVLRCCRLGHEYPALLSFWASTITEAIARKCEQFRSARLEAQKQNQEDVMLLILPTLNDAMSMSGVPELRIASYMVLIVLASKINLNDDVLAAMMEAVGLDLTGTSHAGLICLAILAERMRNIRIPKRTLKALLSLERLDDDLITLQNKYNVEKLTLGTILGITAKLRKHDSASGPPLLKALLDAKLMGDQCRDFALRSLLPTPMDMSRDKRPPLNGRGSFGDLVLNLLDSPTVGVEMRTIIRQSEGKVPQLDMFVPESVRNTEMITQDPPKDVGMLNVEEKDGDEEFDEFAACILSRTAYGESFLSHSKPYDFGSLEQAFQRLSRSTNNLQKFSCFSILREPLAVNQTLFLSFFVRTWCGTSALNVRTAAVNAVEQIIKNDTFKSDIQFMLPYILYGLADPASSLRKATGDLVLSLASSYNRTRSSDVGLRMVGHDKIYGSGEYSKSMSWLSFNDVGQFLTNVLTPGLEECLLDGCHISRLLVSNLSDSKHGRASRDIHERLKTSSRLCIFSCLSSHAVNTPLIRVKLRLVQMLNEIEMVGSAFRTRLLLPILCVISEMSGIDVEHICRTAQISPSELLDAAVSTVTPYDRDGMQVLKSIIEGRSGGTSHDLQRASLRRLRTIWSSLKPELQSTFAETLLGLSVSKSHNELPLLQQAEALQTLSTISLSTPILKSFLEKLPLLSSNLQSQPSASKRRRSSHDESSQIRATLLDHAECVVQRVAIVLELVRESKVERQATLLKGLFQVLADLQHAQVQKGTGVDYLQVSAMDSMLNIISQIEPASGAKIDSSWIRADALTDCIRTTGSPQVRNAGLLLLSALATAIPEVILHSIMPVFTFMGTGVLRQEDEYSSHVIKQTIDSIIPRLVQSLHGSRHGSLSGVSELLLSFAAAFEHVPSQRRLDLYTALVNKVGPEMYLSVFVTILLDKYPRNRRAFQFATEITRQYDVKTQLKTIGHYLELLLDTLQHKPTISTGLLPVSPRRSREDVILNLLPLVPAILTESLVSQTRKDLTRSSYADKLRLLCDHALEQIFLMSEASIVNRRIDTLCMEVLDSVLDLLPVSEMTDAFERLLEGATESSRQQMLRSLKRRLDDQVDERALQKPCIQFLPRLTGIVTNASDVSLRVSAISLLDSIVEKFGKKDLGIVIDCARTLIGQWCLGADETAAGIAFLLCLATVVEIAGEAFIPLIPLTIPRAVDSLGRSIANGVINAKHHSAAYSFLMALLIHVPWMIKGEHLCHLLTASHISAGNALGEEYENTRREALSLIATRIEPRECIKALDSTWLSAMTEGSLAVQEHLEIFRLLIERQPNPAVVGNSEVLVGFLLKAWDFRREQAVIQTKSSYSDSQIAAVESVTSNTAVAIVSKLNDATFRPLFTRMIAWATVSLDKQNLSSTISRRITWYTFLTQFFTVLKVGLSDPNRDFCILIGHR